MLVRPKIGQRVRIHYNKTAARMMPWHGFEGTVIAVGKGPGPRNHAVRVDFKGGGYNIVGVPCGNLVKAGS